MDLAYAMLNIILIKQHLNVHNVIHHAQHAMGQLQMIAFHATQINASHVFLYVNHAMEAHHLIASNVTLK